jgi:hypothetical protein
LEAAKKKEAKIISPSQNFKDLVNNNFTTAKLSLKAPIRESQQPVWPLACFITHGEDQSPVC